MAAHLLNTDGDTVNVILTPTREGRIIKIQQDDNMYSFKIQKGVEMGRKNDLLP